MNILSLIIVLFVALLAVGGGLAIGLVVSRRELAATRQAAVSERDAAVQVAVQSVLSERAETLRAVAAEREHTVTAAVDTVVKVATTQLDSRLEAGTKEFDVRTTRVDEQVGTVADELKGLRELVQRLQRDRAREHGEVVQNLRETAKRTAELAGTTTTLREALASPKARGQWGERMADDVLRLAGFVEDLNYSRQRAVAGGGIPDFTFHLSDARSLNMDVKFPIDNYLRYLEATDDRERDDRRALFAKDVRNRIKEIGGRGYIDPEHTLDFVVLFIPNESVYGFMHDNDAEIVDWALQRKVVLCSPFTLFAVLAVVRQASENFRLEQTSSEILECLGRFSGQWTKFSEHLDKVGKQFDTAQRSFDELSGTRRRVLEKELARIDSLEAEHAATQVMEAAPESTQGRPRRLDEGDGGGSGLRRVG